nr:EAL domain-containing protein [Candidatus Accumulibacter aalborgensis]
MEERQQRRVIEGHRSLLEHQVAERTSELAKERDLVKRYLDVAGVMLMALDRNGRITMINRKGAQILDLPESSLVGMNWFEHFIPDDEIGALRQVFSSLMAGKTRLVERYENRIMTAGGRALMMAWNNTLLRDETGAVTGTLSSAEDITARKAAEDEIRNLAFFDPLTSLPNRRRLIDRLKQAIAARARSKQYGALLFIDLDHFKVLNDTLGHDIGDLLLQQVGKRLTTCVREGDAVARLGGDEFVVMLENLGESLHQAIAHTDAVGRKILTTLNQPYQLAEYTYSSTPSIGITLISDSQGSVDDLLKQADLAMYQAKAAGRDTLRFFEPEMQAAVAIRALLEAALREALPNNQFRVFYQPQVDGQRGLTGVEALLRWQHPQRGLVLPLEFIHVAEETGLILPLGLWVLETACVQLALWAARPEMAHLIIAVNVSVCQLHHHDFVDQVLAVLERTGANAHRLKLELTESLLVKDQASAIAKMTALKTRGVGFSLDDFGTGYSSLAYLKRLPLDQLKIDQSFVGNILTDRHDAAISRMIIALAESVGLEVIAEGVETEAQRDFLARQGCYAYQGYLFSRPLPLADFEELCTPAVLSFGHDDDRYPSFAQHSLRI